MKKNKKPIYLLDYRLSFKTFKKLNNRLMANSGITPMQLDRVIWELMRDRKIYCWLDPLKENDLGMGQELPKGRDVEIIKNGKKV